MMDSENTERKAELEQEALDELPEEALDDRPSGKEEGERDADFSQLDEMEAPCCGGDDGNRELEMLRCELADQKDKYLRALAELENFKKRSIRERADLIRYQGERILADILPVMDNLELALQHREADHSSLTEGLELIYKQFADVLARWEVRADSALGKQFDPNKDNALSRITVDDAQPGTVVGELKKAYFYKDRLLRPGEVVVADQPSGEDEGGEGGHDGEGSGE